VNSPGPLLEPGSDRAHALPASGDDALPGGFERLRDILVGEERRALDAAHARIAALENAQRDLAGRLPDAALEALLREKGNPRVPIALADPVTVALGHAVQRNRQSLVDTLFPVIGPLIRKAIAEALRTLVLDLNGAVESSFSVRGIKWRVEAWRAGVPYAQVVLKHKLKYRIDHVFLIERSSGLVLQHESAPELPPLDADAIAGMLTALGDFVGDSVGQGQHETLESMRVGDHVVWVIEGPRANLAGFFRGVPPPPLRALLEQRLEDIHSRLAAATGAVIDTSPENHETWHTLLEPAALLGELETQQTVAGKAPSRTPLYIGAALILFVLGWQIVSRERWSLRIDALRARLEAHPGFVLTGLDSRRWRSVTVHGLLDPDAETPQSLLAGADLGKVDTMLDVHGYLSASDAIVERRALRLLAPPPGVRVAVKDGLLILDGTAARDWIASARERSGWVAGVGRVAFSVSPDVDPVAVARAELETLIKRLPTERVLFVDETDLAPESAAILDSVARDAQRARALAATARVQVALTGIGLNDGTGRDETNVRLRAARSRWLADALRTRGIEVAVGDAPTGEAATSNQRAAYLLATIGSPP
jgi:outer membrane protein OmpA-like peptidoglycan-associated protein